MNRRKATKSLLGLTAASLITGLYTWQIEPFWLEFVKKKMPIKGPNHSLNNKRLIQISDIHVGNRFDWQFIIDSLKEAQSLNPDIVVYTGDYVSYENRQQLEDLNTVLQSAVKGKLATIAILGNHDYGLNWSENKVANRITSILEQNDIQVLRNESIQIEGLNIIGMDDFWGKNFNPQLALKSKNHYESNLVLCHNPDVCDLNVWDNYEGWILSGHTHGGQCKPPFLKPQLLPVKNKAYAQGQIDLKDGRQLYVNRALGHLHQVRFNVRPEITVFDLLKEA